MAPAADAPFLLLVETGAADRASERALLFTAPRRVIACQAPNEVAGCLSEADAALRSGSHVAGFLAYEAGYGLHPKLAPLARQPLTEHVLWLAVCDAPRELVGQQLSDFLSQCARQPEARVTGLRIDLQRERYHSDFERIQAYLRAGDTYQVCHSLRASFRVDGDAVALFQRLRRQQPTSYSALIDTGQYSILSLSPELFFRRSGSEVRLEPMKGTAAAGRGEAEDAALAQALRQDLKTRAENVMIVDLLRSDIGRLARPGSVRVPELFSVKRYGAVLQMTSTITAELEPGLGLRELMQALFPSGSVTGAPKLRTMQIIAELEQSPRGIFCGSIGYAAPNGDACFNVAIRTLCVDRQGGGRLGVGSGVVVDSASDAEYDECLLKARFVTAALG
ncbi:MAG TPA: aminodeoxychorismate synthase component I [Polyangiaceae bacterium]|nr:aminodeoxychorismate synthase component I [Polyangiaceae bacterium]